MGMFDDVICTVDLPDGYGGAVFQTKDFDCEMTTYLIREDGRLINNPDGKATDTNFHGCFRFYTEFRGKWHEYEAKFDNGKLVEITVVPEREDQDD